MPTKSRKETQKEQSARFDAEMQRFVDAGGSTLQVQKTH